MVLHTRWSLVMEELREGGARGNSHKESFSFCANSIQRISIFHSNRRVNYIATDAFE